MPSQDTRKSKAIFIQVESHLYADSEVVFVVFTDIIVY